MTPFEIIAVLLGVVIASTGIFIAGLLCYVIRIDMQAEDPMIEKWGGKP